MLVVATMETIHAFGCIPCLNWGVGLRVHAHLSACSEDELEWLITVGGGPSLTQTL